MGTRDAQTLSHGQSKVLQEGHLLQKRAASTAGHIARAAQATTWPLYENIVSILTSFARFGMFSSRRCEVFGLRACVSLQTQATGLFSIGNAS